MENTQPILLSVSDFIALTNQVLDTAFPGVEIEGEVSGFTVNQGKYVFFDLKDEGGSLGCFMMVWQLRAPIEDGMRVVVAGSPKLTQKGRFSVTVRSIRPRGEGSIKRSFELLRAKLEKEGLFRSERKRQLPEMPRHIAVISSTQAAGYADFIKIINDRFGGLKIDVAHVQVQGREAPDQVIRALQYFNSRPEMPEVIAILRGGGSADDLDTFNDESLVREIAASRVPTIVGVGHETDTTLSDLAADLRAATPSNAAQLIVPDRLAIVERSHRQVRSMVPRVTELIEQQRVGLKAQLMQAMDAVWRRYEEQQSELRHRREVLAELDPERILARGYAIVRGQLTVGQSIEIEKSDSIVKAEVLDVKSK